MCHCFPHKLLICPKAKLVTHQSIYNVYIHQVNDLLRLSYTKLISLTGLFSLHLDSQTQVFSVHEVSSCG